MHAEHVVNAGGLWAREVGRMVGLELPVLAMEHQYLITEDMPELDRARKEQLHCIDFEGEIYMRQERGGMLLGHLRARRRALVAARRRRGTSARAAAERPRAHRAEPRGRLPSISRRSATSGIRKVVNGPFTFAPDGNPLVGPDPRACATTGWPAASWPASARAAASDWRCRSWMVEGDPGADIWAMDVARYGDWATLAYTNAKVRENYSRRFRIRFPNEELPAARPLRTTPIYERLKARERGVRRLLRPRARRCGSRPRAARPSEQITFRRSNAHPHVAAECRAVRESVGLIEISNYGKFEVTGPGADRMAVQGDGQPRARRSGASRSRRCSTSAAS